MSNDMASILYPSTADQGEDVPRVRFLPRVQAATAPVDPQQQIAQTLYPDEPPRYVDEGAPESVKLLRAGDEGRVMHSPQGTYRTALPDDALPGLDVQAAREVAADYGASNDDVAQFVALARGARHATAEDLAQWEAQCEAAQIPDADLQLARDFVARDPRLFHMLDETGLGSHPKVVARFVELAKEDAARYR
jgi:hypothetical protein